MFLPGVAAQHRAIGVEGVRAEGQARLQGSRSLPHVCPPFARALPYALDHPLRPHRRPRAHPRLRVQVAAAAADVAATRKKLVGSGDRSERIRTYNFPQGRVTDHRINLTLYQLDRVMEGELDGVIIPLLTPALRLLLPLLPRVLFLHVLCRFLRVNRHAVILSHRLQRECQRFLYV